MGGHHDHWRFGHDSLHSSPAPGIQMIMRSGSKKSTFFAKLFLIPAFIVIVFILAAVAKETYKKNQIQKEIDGLKEKADRMDKESQAIQEKISYFESQDYQQKEAKDKFNLQDPNENVVVIKPSVTEKNQTAEPPRAAPPVQDNFSPNPIKWWSYFFKY